MTTPAPLDEMSKRIIEHLQEDGRQSYATIGRAVGLSEAAVRQRVGRLIDGGLMQIVAVTGTSGKTSVAAFTRQIWEALGHEAASLGTIGVVTPKKAIYGSLTTPDPVGLHKTLSELAAEGVTHLAMEASSHGLDQHRLDGVRVAAAGFTNLSRDHLDYHPSVEAYLAAKLRLFEDLVVDGGSAVIDVDHEHSDAVVAAAKKRGLKLITVGRKGEGIRLAATEIDGFAQRLTLVHAGKTYSLKLPLVGAFQVENALVSAGLVIATGGDPGAVFATLSQLKGAKGRLDLVGERNGAPIFVDYAHKPDALEKALAALRPYVKRKLVVVFGAGGNRDAVILRAFADELGILGAALPERVGGIGGGPVEVMVIAEEIDENKGFFGSCFRNDARVLFDQIFRTLPGKKCHRIHVIEVSEDHAGGL